MENSNLNCAETILHQANKRYTLGLDDKALSLATGFGGGMGAGGQCGALSGAIMVLSVLHPGHSEEATEHRKKLNRQFITSFKDSLGSIHCTELKASHWSEEESCKKVIARAAEILDKLLDNAG